MFSVFFCVNKYLGINTEQETSTQTPKIQCRGQRTGWRPQANVIIIRIQHTSTS